MSGPKHILSLLLLGVLASNAFAAANSRVEVVVPEAAPQNTGLLLPTTPSFGSLSAAATAATDLNTPKQAVAATTLPTGPYLPATAALPTRAAPLGIPAAVQPAVAPQLPALGLTVPQAGLQLPAAIQQPQPFPAANPGFIAPANPGFPPLIPGGSGGAAPLGAYPAALPGDGVLGTGGPAQIPGVTVAASNPSTVAAGPGAGLGSLVDTSLFGSSSSSSTTSSGLGMGSSIGDPFAGSSGSSSSAFGGSGATLGAGAGTIGSSSGGMGGTLRSRRAMANAANSQTSSASVIAGLVLAAVFVV